MSQTLQRSMLTPQMAQAARNLAALGSGRDNMLAHINPREAAMLMQMGGKGDRNPRTGLPQFDDGGGGGDSGPAPVTPLLNTGATGPSNFVPSNVAYQTIGGQAADTPYDTALLSSYDVGSLPSGTAPIDPTLANFVSSNIQSLSNSYGGGAQDPFLMAGQPDSGLSQFLATPGNTNFTVDPATGYADFTPAGGAAYNAYATGQEQQIAANAANNRKGDMEGIALALGLPAAVVGAGFGAEGLGLLGDVGAGATDAAGAAGAAGDVFDVGATGTSIVPDAALGTAADPFAVGSAVTSDFAGGLGDAFTGAEGTFAGSTLPEIAAATPSDAASATAAAADAADPFAGSSLGDATSSLASLGENPTLGELAAATPDELVGDASANATTLGANAADVADTATFDDGAALTGGDVTADAAGPSTSLATLDTTQFPGGFILPPDPATGLVTGTGATAAGGSGGGIGGWLSSLASKGAADLSDPFKLLGLGASGIGLLSSLSGQNKNVGNVSGDLTQQQNLANQTNATGSALQGYLTSGTLPPGLMTQVQLATQDSIQNIKSKYAANGMGPNSTPEQQDINRVLQNQASTIAAIGQQLFSSGTADLQIDQSVLNSMLTANTSLNNQTNAAIANLARALSGTPSTTTTTTKTA
jgi:hypothetical protein